jgi:hypothetical protein
VGWFCVQTIATNLNLVEWFDRLLIELDWRVCWLIRSQERPRRKPPDKTTNTKQRFGFTTVFYLVLISVVLSSEFISKSIAFDESCHAIKGRIVQALSAIRTRDTVEVLILSKMQSRKSTIQGTMATNAKDFGNGFKSTFYRSLYVKATGIIVGESICDTTTATWHSNQRSTSMVIAKHDMPFDNQPYLEKRQTAHSTQHSNHLTRKSVSIIYEEELLHATEDFNCVVGACQVVDPSAFERGPFLRNDLQLQKQSFESLDDIRGFHANDAITSMASNSSATSFATSVFKEDQLDSRRTRFCCSKLLSLDHVTIKDFTFSGTDHDSWLIVVSDTASQFHSELDQHVFDDNQTFTDPEHEKRIASYKHIFGNAPTCNNFLDSGLGRPQLSSAVNCFARELVSPSSITIQFSQEVIATFARDNNGVSPIQIRQQIISFEAQIRQRIISLQNGDNEGASPALGSLPISW